LLFGDSDASEYVNRVSSLPQLITLDELIKYHDFLRERMMRNLEEELRVEISKRVELDLHLKRQELYNENLHMIENRKHSKKQLKTRLLDEFRSSCTPASYSIIEEAVCKILADYNENNENEATHKPSGSLQI